MKNTKLQEFVTNAAARSRITFGDVRRLQRDYLPGGVSSREEAEMLIRLDGMIDRADKAWADWLVATIVDFAVWSERSAGGVQSGTREWLRGYLAATGAPTKAARRIVRDIHSNAEQVRPMILLPKKQDGVAVLSDAVEGTMNALELAA